MKHKLSSHTGGFQIPVPLLTLVVWPYAMALLSYSFLIRKMGQCFPKMVDVQIFKHFLTIADSRKYSYIASQGTCTYIII